MAPTLTAAAELSAEIGANTLTSSAFTPANGEVLVVKAGTWSTGISAGTPSGGSLTWTQQVLEAGGSFNGRVSIWTAVVGTSPGSMSVSMTPDSSCHHVMLLERWTGAQLAGTPATGQAFTNSSLAPSATATTTTANSVVTWLVYDNNTADPTSRAYLSSATEEALRNPGSSGIFYFAWQSAATAGTQTFGLSAPSTMRYNMAGLEIQAAGAVAGGTLPARPVIASSFAVQRSVL